MLTRGPAARGRCWPCPARWRQRGLCHLLPAPLALCPRFLRYCREEGGYTGYPYEDESPAEDGLAAELGALQLSE